MPRQLSESDLRRHVGVRFAKRARRSRVDNPTRQGSTLFGIVQGFEVQLTLREPLVSRCTCIYGSRCEHAAALLASWLDGPGRFAVEADLLDAPEDPALLRTWLRTNDPALLQIPVERIVDRGRWMAPSHPLWNAMHLDLDTALDVLALEVERQRMAPDVAVQPLWDDLTDVVRRRRRKREALTKAARWRENPPEEEALRPLWERARALVDVEKLGTTAPGAYGRAKLLPSQELEVELARLPGFPLVVPLGVHLFDEQTELLAASLAGVVLDSVVGHHQPDVRKAVLQLLAVPAWERALLHLDEALALEGPASANTVGWRLVCEGPRVDEAVLVGLTPYKRKAGFRSKKLTVTLADLERAADRAAYSISGPVEAIVEQLVGHPAVIDDKGQLLRVRRGALEVRVEDTDGFEVHLELFGHRLDRAALAVVRVPRKSCVLRVGREVVLVRVGPVLAALAGVLGQHGASFPEEARGPLLDRLNLLDRRVPLRLEGELRGEPVEPDRRPVVLLEPLPDGALQVTVCLEPLAGAGRVVPGEGAEELAHAEDGQRRFVVRDLEAEPEQVRAALEGLPMPELFDWVGTHDLPDDALELVWRLRTEPSVRSFWPKRRVRFKPEGQASMVRARAHRRRDWFGVEGALRAGDTEVGLSELLRAIRSNQRFIQLDDGSWLRLADGLRRALRSAAQIGTDEEEVRLPPLAAARAMLALEEAGGDTYVPDELTDLADRIRAADDLAPEVPEGLQAELRDYQLEGLTWLRRLASWAPGAVLADEMGLGKTLQSLALLLERGGRALVVAPASVNINWQREAQRFTPSLEVELYRGRHRKRLLAGDEGVLITSYELLVRDVAELSARRFDTVVFDEAQALKNPRTKRARAARALDIGFALALSGTPIENDVLELWSLMRVTVPGLLGPKEHFHERFGKKLMAAESMGNGNLGALVRPFLLRRTKRLVAPELPERVETIDWVELSATERVAYDRLRMAAVAALQSDDGPDRMSVLAALTRLRQVACSERLVDPRAKGRSSKIDRMLERVELARSEGGVLVFSQFTRLLDLAQEALETAGITWVRLDGSTPMGQRQAAVDRFQAGGAEVFLISLKAGGTGLNLTAATTVLHLDPWWNPAAEDQASDRAHRIGQTRQVTVVRLVSVGTVEEQVLQLHDEKRQLADRLFEGTSGALNLRSDELLALLDV